MWQLMPTGGILRKVKRKAIQESVEVLKEGGQGEKKKKKRR